MAKAKGTEFEKRTLSYLNDLFESLGFPVLRDRQQLSGTQNGFDLVFHFLDGEERVRKIYFECKEYTASKLDWKEVAGKILELSASRHPVDAFIAISPYEDVSNIGSEVYDHLPGLVRFPIRLWTPEYKTEEYFSLDNAFYEYVYGTKSVFDDAGKEAVRQKLRAVINDMLEEKDNWTTKNADSILPKELTLKMPKVHPDDIIGRKEDLEELHGLLFNNKRVVVVNGLGGIGKTTLAQAYLSKYYKTYRHIVWITQLSGDIANDINNATSLAENLGVSREGKEVTQLCHAILNELKAIPGGLHLLVLDNVDEQLRDLKDYLPGQPDWHVLITSRKQVEGFHPKVLDFLSPEQSIALFKKYCRLVKDDALIAELVKTVDYHTLTIEILAKTAQLRKTGIEILKKAIQDDLISNADIIHKGGKIDRVRSYLSSIFILSDLNSEEAWLMKQFTCLPTEFHTYNLLLELTNPDDEKKASIPETLNTLVQQGWLLYNEETDAYKMHVIVKEIAVRQLLPALEDIEGLLDTINESLSVDETKDNPVDKFRWIPFGHALLRNFPDDDTLAISTLQNNLALRLKELGDYASARTLLEEAVNSAERNFGPDHSTTATVYANLGLVLKDLGDYAGARTLLEKAVHSDERNFGLDHPTTAGSYSNLSLALRGLGDYAGARFLLEKAINIDEHNLGSGHPANAIWYSNLALVLQELGDFAGAQPLLEKAIRSNEGHFGPDHPTTAVYYSNLALVLKGMGDYAGARSLLEKAVGSNERNLGSDHPSTAVCYSNLAMVLESLGDYAGALELLTKSLSILKKTLPEGHPNTQTAQYNYDSIKAKL